MKNEEQELILRSILRKRSFSPRKSSLKAEILNIIDKQRQDLQEAGAHLIWKRKSQESLKYDVVIIIPPKGFHIIDSLLQLINEMLPNLIVDIKPHSHNKEQAIYITANEDYLLESAKLLSYRLEQTLTSLQRQSIVLHFLNSLRWIKTDIRSHTIEQEFKSLKFSEGEAVIAKLISLNLIKQVLPLHNERDLSQLRLEWVYSFFSAQPLDKICRYFGVKIAIYFAFLGYYTFALVFPATLGLLITIIGHNFMGHISILAFIVINIIWSTVFLQNWKHSNEKLIQTWSSMHFGTTVNFVRPLFRGNLIHNLNSSGHIEIQYPGWKRKLFKYFVTFPIIGLSLLSVLGVMFAVFELQVIFKQSLF
jgi:anoctamin-8